MDSRSGSTQRRTSQGSSGVGVKRHRKRRGLGGGGTTASASLIVPAETPRRGRTPGCFGPIARPKFDIGAPLGTDDGMSQTTAAADEAVTRRMGLTERVKPRQACCGCNEVSHSHNFEIPINPPLMEDEEIIREVTLERECTEDLPPLPEDSAQEDLSGGPTSFNVPSTFPLPDSEMNRLRLEAQQFVVQQRGPADTEGSVVMPAADDGDTYRSIRGDTESAVASKKSYNVFESFISDRQRAENASAARSMAESVCSRPHSMNTDGSLRLFEPSRPQRSTILTTVAETAPPGQLLSKGRPLTMPSHLAANHWLSAAHTHPVEQTTIMQPGAEPLFGTATFEKESHLSQSQAGLQIHCYRDEYATTQHQLQGQVNLSAEYATRTGVLNLSVPNVSTPLPLTTSDVPAAYSQPTLLDAQPPLHAQIQSTFVHHSETPAGLRVTSTQLSISPPLPAQLPAANPVVPQLPATNSVLSQLPAVTSPLPSQLPTTPTVSHVSAAILNAQEVHTADLRASATYSTVVVPSERTPLTVRSQDSPESEASSDGSLAAGVLSYSAADIPPPLQLPSQHAEVKLETSLPPTQSDEQSPFSADVQAVYVPVSLSPVDSEAPRLTMTSHDNGTLSHRAAAPSPQTGLLPPPAASAAVMIPDQVVLKQETQTKDLKMRDTKEQRELAQRELDLAVPPAAPPYVPAAYVPQEVPAGESLRHLYHQFTAVHQETIAQIESGDVQLSGGGDAGAHYAAPPQQQVLEEAEVVHRVEIPITRPPPHEAAARIEGVATLMYNQTDCVQHLAQVARQPPAGQQPIAQTRLEIGGTGAYVAADHMPTRATIEEMMNSARLSEYAPPLTPHGSTESQSDRSHQSQQDNILHLTETLPIMQVEPQAALSLPMMQVEPPLPLPLPQTLPPMSQQVVVEESRAYQVLGAEQQFGHQSSVQMQTMQLQTAQMQMAESPRASLPLQAQTAMLNNATAVTGLPGTPIILHGGSVEQNLAERSVTVATQSRPPQYGRVAYQPMRCCGVMRRDDGQKQAAAHVEQLRSEVTLCENATVPYYEPVRQRSFSVPPPARAGVINVPESLLASSEGAHRSVHQVNTEGATVRSISVPPTQDRVEVDNRLWQTETLESHGRHSLQMVMGERVIEERVLSTVEGTSGKFSLVEQFGAANVGRDELGEYVIKRVEVPVHEEKTTRVPKKEVRHINVEKKVPQVVEVEKIVEVCRTEEVIVSKVVEKIEEKIVHKPVKQVVERPVEQVVYRPVVVPVTREEVKEVPGQTVYVEKKFIQERVVIVPRYIDRKIPTVVAQSFWPRVTEASATDANAYIDVQCRVFNFVPVPQDVYVPLICHRPLIFAEMNTRHREVLQHLLPHEQYNTLVQTLNPSLSLDNSRDIIRFLPLDKVIAAKNGWFQYEGLGGMVPLTSGPGTYLVEPKMDTTTIRQSPPATVNLAPAQTCVLPPSTQAVVPLTTTGMIQQHDLRTMGSIHAANFQALAAEALRQQSVASSLRESMSNIHSVAPPIKAAVWNPVAFHQRVPNQFTQDLIRDSVGGSSDDSSIATEDSPQNIQLQFLTGHQRVQTAGVETAPRPLSLLHPAEQLAQLVHLTSSGGSNTRSAGKKSKTRKSARNGNNKRGRAASASAVPKPPVWNVAKKRSTSPVFSVKRV